jgi:hypothetical protein
LAEVLLSSVDECSIRHSQCASGEDLKLAPLDFFLALQLDHILFPICKLVLKHGRRGEFLTLHGKDHLACHSPIDRPRLFIGRKGVLVTMISNA